MTFIYTLTDPRDNRVRYVGKSDAPNRRLIEHLSESKTKNNVHKHNWINRLLLLKLKPVLQIIEECSDEVWQERERYWIKHHRDLGCKLTNATDGGEGVHNPSVDARERVRQSKLGGKHTDEHKQKISNSLIGMFAKEKNPMWGRKLSVERKQLQRLNSIKLYSDPEMRKRVGDISRGIKDKNATSKFHGVSWDNRRSKWRCRLNIYRKCYELGFFDNELDAAKRYNEKALDLLGDKAKINVLQ